MHAAFLDPGWKKIVQEKAHVKNVRILFIPDQQK